MTEFDGFEPVFEDNFELDPASRQMGGALGDEDVLIEEFIKKTQVILLRGEVKQVFPQEGAKFGEAYYYVPLICTINPHPKVTLKWAQLNFDFSPTSWGGGRIQDLSPTEIKGDKPVELETTVGVGLKFGIKEVVEIEPKMELTTKKTVYYPEITGVGRGTKKGRWNFYAFTDGHLYVDRQLELLISAKEKEALEVTFTVEAESKFALTRPFDKKIKVASTIITLFRP